MPQPSICHYEDAYITIHKQCISFLTTNKRSVKGAPSQQILNEQVAHKNGTPPLKTTSHYTNQSTVTNINNTYRPNLPPFKHLPAIRNYSYKPHYTIYPISNTLQPQTKRQQPPSPISILTLHHKTNSTHL